MKLSLSQQTVYEMCMHSWDTPRPTAPLLTPHPLPDSPPGEAQEDDGKEQKTANATFVTLRVQLRAARKEIFDLTASGRYGILWCPAPAVDKVDSAAS